jgi:uracil-DNA glycosylase family 4
MPSRRAWNDLNRRIDACSACDRLLAHCRRVAVEKRAAYRDWDYWGRPVPNMGLPTARLLIVGLAPGAHGSNRTGQMFTGDASGDWLFRALHRAGFATQPHAERRGDGLELIDCAITAIGHCAPPQNKLARDEIENCRGYFERAIDLSQARVFLALGGIAWREMFRLFRTRRWHEGPLPLFRHGKSVELADGRWALASYHPSRQNTNTGRLTEAMLDAAFGEARRLLSSSSE